MWRAKGQAERYARHLPESEPAAPFLLVVDVGHSIEVYADFTQAGRAYQAFPESADFVMYWWHKAAALVRAGAARRFGLITTNSLRQTFNRRVVEAHLKGNAMAAGSSTGVAGSSTGVAGSSTGVAGSSTGVAGSSTGVVGSSADVAGSSTGVAGSSTGVVGSSAGVVGSSTDVAGSSTDVAGSSTEARKRAQKGQKPPTTAPAPLKSPALSLLFAIPDHPWVDTAEGAAVAAAYGWPADLTDAEILTRLVALNAERAAEEARGHIRWLRPDYQTPAGTPTQTGLEKTPAAATKAKGEGRKAKEPWPRPLAERVAATERALRAAAAPLTAAQLAKHFARAKAGDVAEILDTLAALGRAHREGDLFRA